MKSKASKNIHGLKLEYNPNNSSDVKLAIDIARYWHQRGATENTLVARVESFTVSLRQKAA